MMYKDYFKKLEKKFNKIKEINRIELKYNHFNEKYFISILFNNINTKNIKMKNKIQEERKKIILINSLKNSYRCIFNDNLYFIDI